ncbi:MAG: LPS translocon maturation chaperone LptM [Gammaproteobacteria bacterium]
MKKTLSALLLVICLSGLASCGQTGALFLPKQQTS